MPADRGRNATESEMMTIFSPFMGIEANLALFSYVQRNDVFPSFSEVSGMDEAWKAFPHTKLGWAALAIAGVAIILFAVLSLWAEFMSQQPGDTGTAGNIAVVPALLALTSIVLGWIAFAARQDRSYVLLAITLAL